MIKLSKRLSIIADYVDNNATIIDVGCDHALLDIYLIQSKKIKKAIACDIKEGALNQARKNINISGISNIDLRLSDGLDCINEDDNIDTIIISGLGDNKIISILDKDIKKLDNIDTIIIQSNTGINKIRKYMTGINYHISEEKLIKDNNIIYTIIKFKKGYYKYSNKQLEYGPILIKEKGELFEELINNMISSNNKIINKLPNSNIIKKLKLKFKNLSLKSIKK